MRPTETRQELASLPERLSRLNECILRISSGLDLDAVL